MFEALYAMSYFGVFVFLFLVQDVNWLVVAVVSEGRQRLVR